MKLSQQAKDAIATIHPGLVATASKSGMPNVSPKGSFRVLDDEHVLFADVHSPRTVANLKENPQVSVIVLDPASRKGCRVWGKAEFITSGDLFDSLNKEYAARGRKMNQAVKIAVEQVEVF